MGDIISFGSRPQVFGSTDNRNTRRLQMGLIAPAAEEPVEVELAAEHTAEPIKDIADIIKVTEYLQSRGRWRDNMLFILGINFGLRVSDLRELRFDSLINPDCTFKDTFPVFEHKTRNTRKHKKNRYITINDAVIEAVTLYLEHTPGVKMDDYLFRSHSNRNVNNVPLDRKSIDRILKGIGEELDLGIHVSTHTLRKTFAYQQMAMSGNNPRKLLLLSKMLGHSSTVITMDYIGLTFDEMEDAYRNLNLGLGKGVIDSTIGEEDPQAAASM